MTSGKRLAFALGIGLLTTFASLSAAEAQYGYPPPPPGRAASTAAGSRSAARSGVGIIDGPNCTTVCGGAFMVEGHLGGMLNPRLALVGDAWLGARYFRRSGDRKRLDLQQHLDDRAAVLGHRHHLAQGRRRLRQPDDQRRDDSDVSIAFDNESGGAIMGAAGIEVVQSYNWALESQVRGGPRLLQRRRSQQPRLHGRLQLVLIAAPEPRQPHARGAEHDACGSPGGASPSSRATPARSLTRSAGGTGVAFALIAAAAIARGARPSPAMAGVRSRSSRWARCWGRAPCGPPRRIPRWPRRSTRDDAQEIEGTVARGPESTGTGARLIVALSRIAGAPASGTLALAVVRRLARFRARRADRLPGAPPRAARHAQPRPSRSGAGAAGGRHRRAGGRPRRGRDRAPRRADRRRSPADRLPRPARAARRDRSRGARGRGGVPKTAVLGDRRGIGPDVEEGFRVAGATHVLSVSGLHLAAVAALLFFVVRSAAARVPRLPLYVDPRAVAAAVALPAIALFALVTGEAIATLRSALMLSIGMGAYLVGRRASAAPAIAAAALVLLAGSPLELADPSLQLSLASVVGIALGARGIGPGATAGEAGARGARSTWLWRFVARDDRGHGGDRAAGGPPLRRGRAAVAAGQPGAGSDRRAGGGSRRASRARPRARCGRRWASCPWPPRASRRRGRWRSRALSARTARSGCAGRRTCSRPRR